ncbi:Lcl C-terminal domain-containing protein [Nitrospina gracilis]|uniref:Lcl C-terminal domain-containing protein n=1 Tax=Nitrospina gracilis TaxID=35801 RepID=UPI001F4808E6|nr:DUF1566 domain-containing protein [Nitrospina gracilis]MCF8720841.1 hypothetical protein [Nitrospina gracilis Nb-211]
MRILAIGLILWVSLVSSAWADCTKEEVCTMMKTMGHFDILNQCPNAAPLLVECKKVSETPVEELPDPQFVENGDGTVKDTVNNLEWLKAGIRNQKYSLKEAEDLAMTSQEAGKTGWRIPTLPELKTLLYNERVTNASGQKAWINPIFDDGRGHYYWTSTTCEKVSVVEDRYQKKLCQQGDQGAWLIHFNIGAIFWHHTTAKNYYVWLVRKSE